MDLEGGKFEKAEPSLSPEELAQTARFVPNFIAADFNSFIHGLLLPNSHTINGIEFGEISSPGLVVQDPTYFGGPPLSLGIRSGNGIVVRPPSPCDALSVTCVQMGEGGNGKIEVYDEAGSPVGTGKFQQYGALRPSTVVLRGIAKRKYQYVVFGTDWIISRVVFQID